MGKVKQIDIKNRTYYFCNYITDLKSNLLKIDKKLYKDIDISNIRYVTIKKFDSCENIYNVNPLYLRINHASGYIEGKGVNKYLLFDSTDEKKVLLKNIMMFLIELGVKLNKQVMASVIMKKIT